MIDELPPASIPHRQGAALPEASMLLESMTEGVSLSTEDGIIIYTNQAEDQMFGYDAGALIGAHVSTLNAYPEAENQRIVAEVIDHLRTQGRWEGEWLNRRKDGTAFITASRITPVRIEGRMHWLCVQRDITEERATEEALRTSERRMRAVLEATSACFFAVDASWHITLFNRAAEEFFEISREEAIGRCVWDVFPMTGATIIGAHMRSVMETREAVSFESASARHPDRMISARIAPKEGGGLALSVTDITARRRAEDALRSREEQLSAVFAQTAAGLGQVDLTGRFTLVNDRFCAITGRSREELLALRMQDITHPDDLTANLPLFEAAVKHGTPYTIEKRYIRPDRSVVWISNSVSVIRSSGGVALGVLAVTLDITERKQAEARQRLLIDELNHRVKNTLAVVQGIAQQTFKEASASARARQAFEGRLAALSIAHNVLTRESWQSASLREIVEAAAAPFDETLGRFSIAGPVLRITPKTAVSLSLALHELGTNALKYGALSTQEGRVAVRWTLDDATLSLVWEEQGGPMVELPASRGFGTRMIERGLAAELGGTVAIEFRPEGLVCHVRADLPQADCLTES